LKTISEIRNEKKSTREEIYRRVNRGKVAIESSLFKNISIDEIAKESTLSKYHFIRSFSEINGVSPYKYLLQRRVEEAKKMIEKGDQSISDIALEVGFSDVSAFSKRFKAEVGVSPSKIISNHQ
jgi:AraC-like DNA-binding protein